MHFLVYTIKYVNALKEEKTKQNFTCRYHMVSEMNKSFLSFTTST